MKILIGLFTLVSLSAMASPMAVECTVSSAQGKFHSSNPPVINDSIRIDLASHHLGDSSKGKTLFSRPGTTAANSPYIYGFLAGGKTDQSELELARYSISWLLPKGHLYAVLTVNRDLSAHLKHRWSEAGHAEVSLLDLKCVPLSLDDNLDSDGQGS